MESPTLESRIAKALQDAGHRLTGPRLSLIKAVAAQSQKPFTGEDLYKDLRGTGLGRATVFRTLRVLQDLGLLSRLHLADGCQHYIAGPQDHPPEADHHDRLICRECGRVAYLESCPMSESISRIASESGYQVETHHLDILGLCGECRSEGR